MTAPIILHVPHSSREMPPDARDSIVLDDDDLEVELDRMTDSFTEEIARLAAVEPSTDVTVVAAPVSRLVVDVERFPDEREAMNAVGMGAIYTRRHDGAVLRESVPEHLLATYFEPHAAAVTRAVSQALESHGRAVLIDVHSYQTRRAPYELAAPEDPRPQVCLGTDPLHTPGWLVGAARDAFEGLEIGLDSPFTGTYVPLEWYGTDPRVSSIMIELRRDTYMDECAMTPTAGLHQIALRLGHLIRTIGRADP